MTGASLALPPPLGAGPQPWRRVAAYALLLAAAWSAMELFALPLADIDRDLLLRLTVVLVAENLIFCFGLAAATLLFERHSALLPLLAPVALIVAVGGTFDRWRLSGQDAPDDWLGATAPHRIWASTAYGAMFIAAYRLSMRSERTRRLLAQAEAAREQAQALLDAEQLQALRGQVDPALLLRVMAEVQQRYAGDARGADRLLDALVAFLRAAMPGVRDGTSTLTAELRLAQRYAALRGELEPGREFLDIRMDDDLPEQPFPALLLLPLLDALTGAAPQGAARLNVSCDADRCTLQLSRIGPPPAQGRDWLTPELLYRLQVGLRAAYGDNASLVHGDALTVMLPLASTSTHPTEEALPWIELPSRFAAPTSTTASGA